MAETTKRMWPWKKKSQEKVGAGPGPEQTTESSPRSSPHNNIIKFVEEDVPKVVSSDHARVSDETVTQWHETESKLKQSDAKLKHVIDKLNAAQTEVATKEILVKQHAKVAEEAVTGWEKAEAEAAVMKQQLDTTLHQKLATEDRVSHLDGALKECMKQLRHVREEQEQRIHETLVKKTHENDQLRLEMEAKLAEVGLHLQYARSEASELNAEARAMSGALQEKSKALAEIGDARARAESEAKVLQVQLESVSTESSSLKYEMRVLKKELEIRNEELEYERKATDNASRNQLENVKKIAKLEAECQRLRILVRKKLPGPAALAQMKAEVDALGDSNNAFDLKRRRSLGVVRNVSSPRDLPGMELGHDSFHQNSGSNREAEVLSERLVGMEDELKMLKEALAKRDGDLQASRLMCAKTASKLSNAEEQLEAALKMSEGKSVSKWLSTRKGGSAMENGGVDPWGSASGTLPDVDELKRVDINDFMDDFAEMERLAMSPEKDELDQRTAEDESSKKESAILEEKLLAKESALELANLKCGEVSQQLAEAEEQLRVSLARHSANEAALVMLQEKLDSLGDGLGDGEEERVKDRMITKELSDIVEAQSMSLRSGNAIEAILYDLEAGSQNARELHNDVRRSSSSRSSSDVRYEANGEVLSDAESKGSTRGSDLLTNIRRVVQAVESLAQASGSEHEVSPSEAQLQDNLMAEGPLCRFIHWKNAKLDSNMRRLVGIGNKVVQGETDIVEFLAELTVVLYYLVDICTRNFNHLVDRIESHEDSGGNAREKVPELGRYCSEKSEDSLKLVDCNGNGVDDADNMKGEVDRCLEVGSKGTNGVNDNQSPEKKNFMTDVHGSNEQDSEIYEPESNVNKDIVRLHKKVVVLEEELQVERGRHEAMGAKYLELQQKIEGGGDAASESSAGSRSTEVSEWAGSPQKSHSRRGSAVDLQVRKDQEIQSAAEKLAECQRSILDLGKQLKALSSPADSGDAQYSSDTSSPAARATHESEDSRLQVPDEETQVVNYPMSALHERAAGYMGDKLQPWIGSGANSVPGSPYLHQNSIPGSPGSPFLDRRRFPSSNPTVVPRAGMNQNSGQYPLLSQVNRPISEVKQENGYRTGSEFGKSARTHHPGGLLNSSVSPAASELSLLGSLSVPGSPARSPPTMLPFRPRGASPMRVSNSKSSSGNSFREADSDSSATSFSRFHVSTKSATDL